MKSVEEAYARELHGDLTKVVADFAPDATVVLEGAGVHWNCTIVYGVRRCSIHCFDVEGPEYLTSFEHQDEVRAMGRTPSKADTLTAAKSWIAGDEIATLHARYEFIDQQKRSLESIAAQAVTVWPELAQATLELQRIICDLYELWFRNGNRSCRIYYYGKRVHPDAIFQWDECRLFAFQATDLSLLTLILKLWLCDHVAPSQLQKDFPWIEMGKAARYYEEGRGIEGEFIESWDRIETFYREMDWSRAAAVLNFIAEMRRAGYDRTLRAGQSMFTLVLSRSRRHGLREGQPHLAFQFREEGMDVRVKLVNETTVPVPELAMTDTAQALLKQLEAAAID